MVVVLCAVAFTEKSGAKADGQLEHPRVYHPRERASHYAVREFAPVERFTGGTFAGVLAIALFHYLRRSIRSSSLAIHADQYRSHISSWFHGDPAYTNAYTLETTMSSFSAKYRPVVRRLQCGHLNLHPYLRPSRIPRLQCIRADSTIPTLTPQVRSCSAPGETQPVHKQWPRNIVPQISG